MLALTSSTLWSQVKIGNNPATINSASLLELESDTLGFVAPRVTLDDASTAAPLNVSVAEGTIIYNVDGAETHGYWYWDGTQWVRMTIVSDEPWREETSNVGATSTSTDIYYTNGNVGIGNLTPNDPLDVTGNSHLNGAVYVGDKIDFAGSGLKFHHDSGNNYIDSRVPASPGYTYIRADGALGTTSRLAIDHSTGYFGVNSLSNLIAPLDVNGISYNRTGGTFANALGHHLMHNVQSAGDYSSEYVSDRLTNTGGEGGFAWYVAQNNAPSLRMRMNHDGVLNLSNYGDGEFREDSTEVGAESATYTLAVQEDGDVIEYPFLRNSYFQGTLNGYNRSIFADSIDTLAINTLVADAGGNFNTTDNYYTAPYSGLYLVKVNFRADTYIAGNGMMIKVFRNPDQDGYEFWQSAPALNEKSFTYTQTVYMNQGERMYCFVNTRLNPIQISTGYWSIVCVAAF